VLGNRVTRVGGHGIQILSSVGSLMVKDNIVDSARGGGIVMEENSRASELSIENNQLLRIGAGANQPGQRLAAVRAVNCRQVEVTSNSINGVGVAGVQFQARIGIEVVACESVSIRGNDVSGVGPAAQFLNMGAGILVQPPFDRLDIVDNSVRRTAVPSPAPDNSQWYAVRVGGFFQPGAGAFNPNLLFPFTANVGSRVALLGGLTAILVIAGREIAALRGNLFEAVGLVEAVSVTLAGACVVNDNRCLATHPVTAAGAAFPVVNAAAGAVIASANYVQHAPSNDINIAVRLATAGSFTVLGNVCVGGRIIVNNNQLPAPWAPLNAVSF
jgi:hypothetical protein